MATIGQPPFAHHGANKLFCAFQSPAPGRAGCRKNAFCLHAQKTCQNGHTTGTGRDPTESAFLMLKKVVPPANSATRPHRALKIAEIAQKHGFWPSLAPNQDAAVSLAVQLESQFRGHRVHLPPPPPKHTLFVVATLHIGPNTQTPLPVPPLPCATVGPAEPLDATKAVLDYCAPGWPNLVGLLPPQHVDQDPGPIHFFSSIERRTNGMGPRFYLQVPTVGPHIWQHR